MKKARGMALIIGCLLWQTAWADPEPQDRAEHMPAAPYLLAGAPTFDMTIAQFREKYNLANPELPISEYRAIDNRDDKSNLTRAASKINENLYASTALEHGTGKIKTLQITWLPIQGAEEKSAHEKALAYMTAMMRFFVPGISAEEATKRMNNLLNKGKGSRYFTQTEGALRFVVADNGEKGLTFAIEPIKLSLATP
ncbi:YiiQ family protein [Erwinia toletana]